MLFRLIYPYVYKLYSPLAFKDEKLEKEFITFFYGRKLIRMLLLFTFATCFWAVLTYSDFTDYKMLSPGLKIANYCLRGLGLLMIASSLILYIPPLRRNHYLIELLANIVGFALIGLTGIKHAFKNDTTQLPTILQLVGWAYLAGLGCRFHTMVLPSLFSWVGYTVTMIAVDYTILSKSFFYVSSSMVFVTYFGFIFQAFCREKEFRTLFLAGRKLKLATEKVKRENERSTILLKNIFPRHFVEDDSLRGARFVQSYNDLAVLVHDLVSFTAYATKTPGDILVKQLNRQFSLFESLAEKLNLEKLKSAGDSLTLFALDGKPGATRCVFMGSEMIRSLQLLNKEDGTSFSMRVGVAIGQGFLAVMGNDQLEFDGFGSVMMHAEEMEQESKENRVHVTREVYEISQHLYEYEPRNPGSSNSYLLVQARKDRENLLTVFTAEYQKRLIDSGMAPDSVIDDYVDRIRINQSFQSSALSIFNINPTTDYEELIENQDAASQPSSKDVEIDLTLQEYRKKYKPNPITTLFNSVSVTKHLLKSSYKKRVTTLRITFLIILLMLFTHLVSLSVMYPEVLDANSQIVRYSILVFATSLASIFILFPPLSNLPQMGAFTSVTLTLLMTVYMYTLLFEKRALSSQLGDQGLIFLAWTAYSSSAIPWLLKTFLFFACCVIYLIFFSILSKFFLTLVVIFMGMSMLNILVFHSVHYAIAKSFSNYQIVKKELHLLKKEEEMNNNLMRSVVPDKLVSHLKNWVEKHFDVMKDGKKATETQMSLGMLERNRVAAYGTPNSDTEVFHLEIYNDLHTSSFIESGTSLFFYLTNYHSLIAKSENPVTLITMLHELFSFFDSIVIHLGCSKVKWKGCSYIAIAGSDGKEDHANSLLKVATYMLDIGKRFFQGAQYEGISIKIGLDTGTFHEALLGTTKFRQDYFSDTLNTSSRMASTAKPDSIQITERVFNLVKDEFKTQCNGEIEIKGKGKMITYTVL